MLVKQFVTKLYLIPIWNLGAEVSSSERVATVIVGMHSFSQSILLCCHLSGFFFVFFRTRDGTLGLGKQSTTELHPGLVVALLTVLCLSSDIGCCPVHLVYLDFFQQCFRILRLLTLCFVKCFPLLFLTVVLSRIVFRSVLVYK